jgi:hypothetical protein
MVARRAASGAPQNPAMPHMVVAAYKGGGALPEEGASGRRRSRKEAFPEVP